MSSKEATLKLFDDIEGLPVIADNCANPVSLNGGLAIPVAIEKGFGIDRELAEMSKHTRDPAKVLHSQFDSLLFRILAIAAGYEDCNNFDTLRKNNIFKAALRRLPLSLKN